MLASNTTKPASKPSRKEIPIPSPSPTKESPPNPNSITKDAALSGAEFLSREEVIRRRSGRMKQLIRLYRRHYWAIMEEIRVKHRDYYWEFGKSPIEEENVGGGGDGDGEIGDRKRCACVGCKSKAMPLTNYCHSHILFDSKQTLYKACNYVIKSTNNGPQICGKPVLIAAAPSLCPAHFQRAQKQVSQALKKTGLNISSQNKQFPKLSVLISQCVRQIQAKRLRKRPALTKPENDDTLTTPIVLPSSFPA